MLHKMLRAKGKGASFNHAIIIAGYGPTLDDHPIHAYEWDDVNGEIGSKYPDPPTQVLSNSFTNLQAPKTNPAKSVVLFHRGGTYYGFRWSSGFGAVDESTGYASGTRGAFAPNSNKFIGCASSAFLVREWNDATGMSGTLGSATQTNGTRSVMPMDSVGQYWHLESDGNNTGGTGRGTLSGNSLSYSSQDRFGYNNLCETNSDRTFVLATATSNFSARGYTGSNINASAYTQSVGSTAYWAAFSPSGDRVLVGFNSSPRIAVYPFSAGGGFGAALANPATLPSAAVYHVAFSPSGAFVALAYSTGVGIYEWTGNAIGAFRGFINTPLAGARSIQFMDA